MSRKHNNSDYIHITKSVLCKPEVYNDFIALYKSRFRPKKIQLSYVLGSLIEILLQSEELIYLVEENSKEIIENHKYVNRKTSIDLEIEEMMRE